MPAPLHITEAESAVLDALWRLGPLPPQTLIAELKDRRAWAATTIKTLLSRLIQKGAVLSERSSGRLQYRPLVDRRTYVENEVQALADRLFGGDRLALAEYLAETRA